MAHRVRQPLEWGALQVMLAVADAGSLAGASRRLGVNHTTVLRRVAAFEAQLGVRLFERLPTGYVLTASGEELAAAARQVQETVFGVERRLLGKDLSLTGSVRVTTADTLAVSLLPPVLARFRQVHPEVWLELATSSSMASLSKREADVAVRPSRNPPENLVGRRVAEVAIAIYATPRYLAAHPAKQELARQVWIAPDDSLSGTTIARWMRRQLTDAPVAMRADSLVAMAYGALAGVGVAALPCYLGDRTPGLRRVRNAVAEMATELWVLTHEDLRGTARIRALTDFLAGELGRERALIEGRQPRKPA
jgi:DNA-binding transcriptional LysR family regulator